MSFFLENSAREDYQEILEDFDHFFGILCIARGIEKIHGIQ